MGTKTFFIILLLGMEKINGNKLKKASFIGETTAYEAPMNPTSNKGCNPVKEAVKALQLDTIKALRKEILDFKAENILMKEEKTFLVEKEMNSLALIEEMKKDHNKEIKGTKEAYEGKIDAMKENFMEKETILKRSIEKMGKYQEDEMRETKQVFEDKQKVMKENYLERETVFNNKLSGKDSLVEYVLDVLRDSEEIMESWQNTIKIQAEELNKSNRNIEKCQKNMNIFLQSQQTIRTQSKNIERLELMMLNDQNLTRSYENLLKQKVAENKCEGGALWMSMSILNDAINMQKMKIDTLTDYLKDQNNIEEDLKSIQSQVYNKGILQSVESLELLTNYQDLIEIQSQSISLLRKMLTNKGHSTCGLRYEEDDHGRVISASTCECVPIPPVDTGLKVKRIQFECNGRTHSTYDISCSEKQCRTETWPTCEIADENAMELREGNENVSWKHVNCKEVKIPYLNQSISCGSHGMKVSMLKKLVGNGVFNQELTGIPCSDCDEELFQWSSWSRVGNKMKRTRGDSSIMDSYEEEEKIVNDPQCSKHYSVLQDSWRQIRYGVAAKGQAHCDSKISVGWYRFKFSDAPYASIPTTRPPVKYTQSDMKTCGTHAVSYMPETLPAAGDPPKDVDIYFAWQSNDQHNKFDAKIVACDENGHTMYLYYLKPVSGCSLGYCAL